MILFKLFKLRSLIQILRIFIHSLIKLILHFIIFLFTFTWFLELGRLIQIIIHQCCIVFCLLCRLVAAIFLFFILYFYFIYLIDMKQFTIYRLLFYNKQIHCILLVHLLFSFSFYLLTYVCLSCITIRFLAITDDLWLKLFTLYFLLRYLNFIFWLLYWIFIHGIIEILFLYNFRLSLLI
jgi:hypothetical protein